MPFRDGTGPDSKGPLTGRGLGNCLFGGRAKIGSFGIGKRTGIGIAVVGLIAHDIVNPDGISRKLLRGLTHCVSSFMKERKSITDSTDRKKIDSQ